MEKLNPYLRYVAISNHLPNKDFVKAYDCRFLFVLSGKGELITEEKVFPLSENMLVYYPSGLPYFLLSNQESPMSFVTVNFDFTKSYPERKNTIRAVKPCDFFDDMLRATQNEIGEERFCSAFTVERAGFLRDDFLSLASLSEKKGKYGEEVSFALLKYIILKIANILTMTSQENKTVRRVIDFIEGNYSDKIDNHTVAAHFGYHPYYLSSLFKDSTGKTLHAYILETRLKFGSDMLLHTDMPIADIAVKCGFQNSNHFSVKFKARYGESPARWRRLNSVI